MRDPAEITAMPVEIGRTTLGAHPMTGVTYKPITQAAQEILSACRENFPEADQEIQQALCLAEEVGEFIGAFRRWKGLARRNGTGEDMATELADVLIVTYVTAAALEIDLDHAVFLKLQTIFSRGWKDAR